ncbi:MAG: SDR family oxidoreductase [Bacteroidetes bacterium]|nr:SDR family oxidoreductase [Bacteroidota bacterium]
MSQRKWNKVAIVNVGDAIGLALVTCFVESGAKVLAIDETRNLAQLPPKVEALGLRRALNDVAMGEAVLQGMERWGVPDLLVNNFSTGFLSRSSEEEPSDWDWGAEATIRRGLSATAAFAALRQAVGNGLVLNVGVGRGLIPEGCPMHYSLLGIMRSLALSKTSDLEMANVCLHNIGGRRPECQPCADQVLLATAGDGPEDLTQMVCQALKSIGDSYQ